MFTQPFSESFAANPAENYERYFVPAIGKPLAEDLIALAELEPGERVLDVACGTAIVARLASEKVQPTGSVAGIDVNADMLAVARAVTPPDTSVEWYEASGEEMPLPDEAFDVVLCQLGLQFVADKVGALREMRRVLADGGRLIVTVSGPPPRIFAKLAEEMGRHVSPRAAGFVNQVFSLHDSAELRKIMDDAGFSDVAVEAKTKALHLPSPRDFLWQYIHSTPLIMPVTEATAEARAAMERDVIPTWQRFEQNGVLTDDVRIVTASARRQPAA